MVKGDMTHCGVVKGPFGRVKAVASIARIAAKFSVFYWQPPCGCLVRVQVFNAHPATNLGPAKFLSCLVACSIAVLTLKQRTGVLPTSSYHHAASLSC
jgi:hypothetical protein